ncbi:B3 domain-containing protein Os01g0723500-like isoform X2 [Spinacia oleracea]|nr:B3 domain-containing protein Os01g0723500-like isoform X2 [Spinacia oleracea]XP_056697543.1 B3 domain-containing protein Os01g0723500-like isoform X2 [Spinacia oleracea]XP_056697547.1 B3 domain-containing protein Os01g0723500-like isoform X2 [Spinacia oleracea]
MANVCAKCKTWRKNQYWNVFPHNKHHFFKVMLGDFRNYLRIPRKFKDEYTEKLSKEMTLRGPSGNYWTAALAQRGEDIQLQDGWRDFVKDHSLEEGNFLVFQHVKDSLFDVLIFDKTGCEREDSHFVEQDGDLCHENCCTMFKNTNQQTNNTSLLSEDEDEDEDEDEEESQQELGTNSKTRQWKYYESNRRPITKKDKERAFHLASKHSTTRPSCMIKMRPSHVHHLFILTINRDFADHCLSKESQDILLRVDSKIWKVALKHRNVQCTLNKGWAQFVLENNLETEDYCVLELADTGESQQTLTLDVYIFRAVKEIVPLKVVLPS